MREPCLDAYTVCWVSTRDCELVAAKLSLDKEHAKLPTDSQDTNSYVVGEIGRHNFIIVFAPRGQSGIVRAVTNTTRTFRQISCVLLVGIGGMRPGIPTNGRP